MEQMFMAAYNDGRGLQEMAAVIEAYRHMGGVKDAG
jgi:hypothetical protein